MEAQNSDSTSVAIKVNKIFDGNKKSFNDVLANTGLGGSVKSDLSYIDAVKTFPENVVVKSQLTTSVNEGGVDMAVTLGVTSNIVLLSKTPMQPRFADDRLGYFTEKHWYFNDGQQKMEEKKLITRWRLEPKDEDKEKYLRGELVEPKKPIVYYIDPATPKQWREKIIAGVHDWQVAFEKAGFKNAVLAKMPTADDKDFDIDDVRYSVITYVASPKANAMGPSVVDPRSGEILESDIVWWHNVMTSLHEWMRIQTGPIDSKARGNKFSDEHMGEAIRFVSSHEVGHTLGLRHNFGSSSTVPVENLRNNAWLKINGHTPSIMDYARFNYVAQPEDKINVDYLMPRIGDYDDWAIEWGYRRFYNYDSPEKEKPQLNKWVIEKLQNPRLWFGTESNPYDPRSQSEQVGDNPMLAGKYGIKNLQRIMENIEAWSTKPNEDFSSLDNRFTQVSGQFSRYLGHVAKYIGGVKETPKMVEQKGAVYELVSKAEQKEALAFLSNQIFTTPNWLLKNSVLTKIDKSPVEVVEGLQNNVLNRVLSEGVLNKLYEGESLDAKAYTLYDYLQDIKNSIFYELKASAKIDIYRRNLQNNFVEDLLARTQSVRQVSSGRNSDFVSGNSDVKAIVRGVLKEMKADASKAAQSSQDAVTKYHLEDIVYRIDKNLEIK